MDTKTAKKNTVQQEIRYCDTIPQSRARSCLEHFLFRCQYQMYFGKPRRNLALEQGWFAVVY